MKVTIEFNLPTESQEYQHALNGSKYLAVLQEVDNLLRGYMKYEDKTTIDIKEVRDMIYDVASDKNVVIWE
jgi:hypothetical protein